MPTWWLRPLWWPALALLIALAVGLTLLAVDPRGADEPVILYAPAERPHPLPRDEAAPRLVDLNRASPAELEALPGVGPRRAQAILEARRDHPFDSLADVLERGVLPRAVLAGLLPFATVQP